MGRCPCTLPLVGPAHRERFVSQRVLRVRPHTSHNAALCNVPLSNYLYPCLVLPPMAVLYCRYLPLPCAYSLRAAVGYSLSTRRSLGAPSFVGRTSADGQLYPVLSPGMAVCIRALPNLPQAGGLPEASAFRPRRYRVPPTPPFPPAAAHSGVFCHCPPRAQIRPLSVFLRYRRICLDWASGGANQARKIIHAANRRLLWCPGPALSPDVSGYRHIGYCA